MANEALFCSQRLNRYSAFLASHTCTAEPIWAFEKVHIGSAVHFNAPFFYFLFFIHRTWAFEKVYKPNTKPLGITAPFFITTMPSLMV